MNINEMNKQQQQQQQQQQDQDVGTIKHAGYIGNIVPGTPTAAAYQRLLDGGFTIRAYGPEYEIRIYRDGALLV